MEFIGGLRQDLFPFVLHRISRMPSSVCFCEQLLPKPSAWNCLLWGCTSRPLVFPKAFYSGCTVDEDLVSHSIDKSVKPAKITSSNFIKSNHITERHRVETALFRINFLFVASSVSGYNIQTFLLY